MIRSRPFEIGGRFLGVLATDGCLWRFRATHPAARHADGLALADCAALVRQLRLLLRQEGVAPPTERRAEALLALAVES